MRHRPTALAAVFLMAALGEPAALAADDGVRQACTAAALGGLRNLATDRADRFLGKVGEDVARCRGGDRAVAGRKTPWVDWANYWATGDATSRSDRGDSGSHVFDRNVRALDGTLLDLEYQRMELIRFNLFYNGLVQRYLEGESAGGRHAAGPTLRVWPEMRLPPGHPALTAIAQRPDGGQRCTGALIRHRTTTGICNDIDNPAMGSTGQLFARNVEFESTFPDLEPNALARNRHGGRLALLRPDPQAISRKLFTRDQAGAVACNQGHGAEGEARALCPYAKAPFFNVLAAYWIQFMTHDWFSHLEEGRNDASRAVPGLGMDAALVADDGPPPTFIHGGVERLARTHRTTRNTVTAWWDASQIYGFDERSLRRVRRDPSDAAKLAMEPADARRGDGERQGYLPAFRAPCPDGAATDACDPIAGEWAGQEAVAFPDNWSIGLSFFHNLFAREHNLVVDAFRRNAREQPQADSGLRDPVRPTAAISYGALSDAELFEVARLVVAAEIAKIHTIEWTPQLLYDEPLNLAMNSNWSGLFARQPLIAGVMERVLIPALRRSGDPAYANVLYSALAAGPGIFGTGNTRYRSALHRRLGKDDWSLADPAHVNGGTNHFGSPFNFPEEFPTVYRLHPLMPDLLEFRDWSQPNRIRRTVPVVATFRGRATQAMRDGGLPSWGVTMGRQRLGLLQLRNHPQFLQHLDLRPRLDTTIDVAALDIVRDRERGIPRFNEFRRQIGLRQLTGFDDFIDRRLPADSPEAVRQSELVQALREVYGQHRCDASKVITGAQRDATGRPIDDCLGHPDGSMVDNIEDVDVVVGMLAETTRPHGFAISETQFQIFILNASRRLFSDRFFTSSFRPEFYGNLGVAWVDDNGPTGKQWEHGLPNGHRQEVSPLKRILLRTMPELAAELDSVVNAFDPWARDRGAYYSLAWKPRPDAVEDEAFADR
ncbi:MAG: oxygenase [Alphaproteobacteria bacterium]|nr:oxygenase [Alphaproteobacteria bacterium]